MLPRAAVLLLLTLSTLLVNLPGLAPPTARAQPRPPLDVVVALDLTTLDDTARAAASMLVGGLDPARDQAALVGFGEHGFLDAQLTSDLGAVRRLIARRESSNRASLEGALVTAQQELASVRARPGSIRVLVLFTDGRAHDREVARVRAEQLKAAGVVIASFGLGAEPTVGYLRSISSDRAIAALPPTADGVNTLLSALALGMAAAPTPVPPTPVPEAPIEPAGDLRAQLVLAAEPQGNGLWLFSRLPLPQPARIDGDGALLATCLAFYHWRDDALVRSDVYRCGREVRSPDRPITATLVEGDDGGVRVRAVGGAILDPAVAQVELDLAGGVVLLRHRDGRDGYLFPLVADATPLAVRALSADGAVLSEIALP